MGLQTVYRQTETLTAFNITNSDDMLACLQDIIAAVPAYSGAVVAVSNGGVTTWTLQFNDSAEDLPGADELQTVEVNGWVIYSSTQQSAIAYTPAQFAQIFTTTPPG